MSWEIERKFLVKEGYKSYASSYTRIIQGYLSSVPERIVRIRIRDDKGYITIKGATSLSKLKRFEWEKEIDVTEAEELLALCEPGVIDKTRYLINAGNVTFEVDEFHGNNTGLVVAELELSSEDEIVEKPDWLGDEITGDKRYYNSRLSMDPFCNWNSGNKKG